MRLLVFAYILKKHTGQEAKSLRSLSLLTLNLHTVFPKDYFGLPIGYFHVSIISVFNMCMYILCVYEQQQMHPNRQWSVNPRLRKISLTNMDLIVCHFYLTTAFLKHTDCLRI
jgi:hypothetical protein